MPSPSIFFIFKHRKQKKRKDNNNNLKIPAFSPNARRMKNPVKILTQFPKRVLDLDFRLLSFILVSLTLLAYVFLSSSSSSPTAFFSLSKLAPLKSLLRRGPPAGPTPPGGGSPNASRIAVCLVGGARRFELTGPSILDRILRAYKKSDLFLHSPLDSNAYKLMLLKDAPRIAAVRIFRPQHIPETPSALRVLTARTSPNGIQGLLQYFNLVEGCLTMIKEHQDKNNFIYDWVIRTRVDGYWASPLGPENFIPGKYVVPAGSSYNGLNDRFGLGDYNTSVVALSRLSLISQLDKASLTRLNSEAAFKAQLTTQKVPFVARALPFCVVTDRKYGYPPSGYGVPVFAMSSPGPLSGAKCRPCTPVCTGSCVGPVMDRLYKWWSWIEWRNDTIQICDARNDWEEGWEASFDEAAGERLAPARKKVRALSMDQCVKGFEKIKKRSIHWDGPTAQEICKLGLKPN